MGEDIRVGYVGGREKDSPYQYATISSFMQNSSGPSNSIYEVSRQRNSSWVKAIYHYCECFVNSSGMPCLPEEQVKRMSTEKNIETPRNGLRLSEPKITGLK